MDDEKLYQVSLSMVPGIGDVTAKTLLSYCGSANAVFKKVEANWQKFRVLASSMPIKSKHLPIMIALKRRLKNVRVITSKYFYLQTINIPKN